MPLLLKCNASNCTQSGNLLIVDEEIRARGGIQPHSESQIFVWHHEGPSAPRLAGNGLTFMGTVVTMTVDGNNVHMEIQIESTLDAPFGVGELGILSERHPEMLPVSESVGGYRPSRIRILTDEQAAMLRELF